MYHERQVGSYCRLHSINNLIGRRLVTIEEFNRYCDEFDLLNKFSEMCSKNSHMYYNYGEEKNIFGFILQKKGIDISMVGYDNWRTNKVDIETDSEDLLGAFVFREGHVWCVRYYNDQLYVIDSLGTVSQVNASYFDNKQLCFLVVRRKLKFSFEK